MDIDNINFEQDPISFKSQFPNTDKACKNFNEILKIDKLMAQIIQEEKRDENFDSVMFFYDSQEKTLHSLFKEELQTKIPNNLWNELGYYIDGLVCLHSINVLVCTVMHPNFETISAEEQNILKWAALFHDIKKRGPPEFDGKDHIHPFVSGGAMLQVFHELGILVLRTEEERTLFQNILFLIEDSHQPVQTVWPQVRPDQNLCQKVHSHKNLQALFTALWTSSLKDQTGRGTFIDLVFRLIMFHQSLTGLQKFPNMVVLSSWE